MIKESIRDWRVEEQITENTARVGKWKYNAK